MIADGRVARLKVDTGSTLQTSKGIHAGDTEASVLSAYQGRVDVEPHKYTSGHYLVVRPEQSADSTFRLIFETNGERVTTYRAGTLPEVRWIEGCA
jgi:hypothetical protein